MNLIDPPEDVARLEIPEITIKELAQSIKEQGQLQPIIVFQKNERYEIVAGHRRWLAIKYLKQKTISCKLVKDEPKSNALARASENLQRSDISPLEEAMIYAGLSKNHHMNYEQIAKITGISAGVVKRRLRILKFPDNLIDYVHKRTIGQSVAEELMRCPDEAYRDYLIQMAADHGATTAVVRGWVNDKIKEIRGQQSGAEGGVQTPEVYADNPIYIACQGCKGPKNIDELSSMGICKECRKIFITMLESGAFKKGGV